MFERIKRAWSALTSTEPKFELVCKQDKRGNWRWHIEDDAGKRLTLMSGSSHERFEDCVREARRVSRARLDVKVIP